MQNTEYHGTKKDFSLIYALHFLLTMQLTTMVKKPLTKEDLWEGSGLERTMELFNDPYILANMFIKDGEKILRKPTAKNNFNRAIITFCYQKAADLGAADGQYKIGQCYEYGIGRPKDHQQAIFWFKKAIEQGHTEATKDLPLLKCYSRCQ